MSADRPSASIVLVAGDQRERASGALASILGQDGIDDAEVILIDAASRPVPPLDGADHPKVRLIRKEKRPTYGEMRAEGVAQARGDIVAFLEEHCVARPGWLRASVEACSGRWVGAGGEVIARNAGIGTSDAVALMYYGRWRAPAQFEETELSPGHNTAYRREALLPFERDLADMLLSEAVLQWKLGEAGHSLSLDLAIKFEHLNETTLASTSIAVYYWHRCFGVNRAKLMGWSVWMKALRVVASPLVPPVRLLKLLKHVLRDRPADLGMFVHNIFVILTVQSCASAGMAMGLLFGPGDAPARLTDIELDAFRGDRSVTVPWPLSAEEKIDQGKLADLPNLIRMIAVILDV